MCQCRYVILLVILWIAGSEAESIRNESICGPYNGRRLYLELGESGILRADNVTLTKNARGTSRTYAGNSSHDQCSLELVTCPSCIITLTFKSINLLHHCGDGGMTIDSPCRCDYVWVSEPPYEDVSGTPFCGHYTPITYRSNTRTLSIVLLYSQSHSHAFTIVYTAERNRLLLKGSSIANEMSKAMNITSGGILTSPFFPSRYPRDLGMEYIISCPTEVPSCRVRVLFSDFQLAAVSIIEFYDWNGQRLDVSSGARFRPPIIVSTGTSLLIRFYANGGTGLGYKAFYSFIVGQEYEARTHPTTDCGGYVENLGGAITMMDMVGEGVKTYDCVWLIRPPKNFIHMKTHMYLKVITFAEMAGTTELIIKQGPTSALIPLEILRHPVSRLRPPKLKEHIAPVASGFHVSLRGSFGPNSRLAIAYAAFSYMDCFTGTDFLCQNHRCISALLNCDGFDHCGDNSDEPTTCLRDWDMGVEDRKWQLNKANYYFPKTDRYPDLKTATLVFVASSLGLLLLISALIVLLYRVGARARQQRELQSRLQTISELLVLNLADGGRIDEISIPDEPPVYEAPPNYDEVIKIGMEEETTGERKKWRISRGNRHNRSISSGQCSHDYESQIALNIHVDGLNANHSSQTMPTLSNFLKNPVPESPPPPYITPPSSTARQFDYSCNFNLPGPSESANISNKDDNGIKFTEQESNDGGDVGDSGDGSGSSSSRRCWLRNSGSFFHSLPTGRTASASPPVSPTSGALGAYAPAQALGPSNFPVPQPGRSSVASGNTRFGCANAPGENAEELEDAPGSECPSILVCSCEGACGCASSSKSFVVESLVARDRIVGLPGQKEETRSCCRLDVSRRLSVDSPDSPGLSHGNSREELADDFDIVSETTSILDPRTSPNIPLNLTAESAKSAPSRKHCASFDLGGLYDSIKALDMFLAQRGSSCANKRGSTPRKSMAVMLFGTPKHKLYSQSENALLAPRSALGRFEASRIRIWQSIDDNFSPR
ncbi:PREDICTED: uncharacterized protein LOC105365530 [Ceratosolen solmsi marchali]|uniref:Uncharacterized protein LOC105365530 n=1 Tax=Ceratosolen solmsi marchali TaxID=326594 RepID=A0AAJ6YPT9_9HYME|nr:PREDICTED: uncharacterized protein LOC105365530 [Ceratosolen solmsi marchali]